MFQYLYSQIDRFTVFSIQEEKVDSSNQKEIFNDQAIKVFSNQTSVFKKK